MTPDDENNTPNLAQAPVEPETQPITKSNNANSGPGAQPPKPNKRMVMVISLVAAVLLIAIGVYLYSNRNDMTDHSHHMAEENTTTSTTSEAMVSIANTGLTPATVSINQGGSVMWTNTDTADHSLVFTGHEDFNSDTLKAKDSFTLTFDEPGTYTYNDPSNKAITGTVVVE